MKKWTNNKSSKIHLTSFTYAMYLWKLTSTLPSAKRYIMMAVSQVISGIWCKLLYLHPSPFLGCLVMPSNLHWCLFTWTSCCTKSSLTTSSSSLVPWEERQGTLVQIPELGESLDASGGEREDYKNRGCPGCPGEETDSCHWNKTAAPGNSLVVQWLGLCTLTASGPGSILGQGTKIPQAAGCGHTHT